jgi:hypothetical protein
LCFSATEAIATPYIAEKSNSDRLKEEAVAQAPEQSMLDEISRRGKLLFDYDKYCAVCTDVLLAKAKPEPGRAPMYIGMQLPSGDWNFAFGKLNEGKTEFEIAYSVSMGPEKLPVLKTHEKPVVDTDAFLKRARAIDSCAVKTKRTAASMNYAVLPASEGSFWVYFYPATSEPHVYLLGGDVRYLVSPDGKQVTETRQMHKSILSWPNRGDNAAASAPQELKAGVHSAIVDDRPEDTDVMHVLMRVPRVPEFVGTKNWIYVIETNGSIKLFSTANPKQNEPPTVSPAP